MSELSEKIENQYVPQLCRLHWSWLAFMSAPTGGIAAQLFALYVSWWVRARRRRGVAVVLYAALSAAFLGLWATSYLVAPKITEDIATALILAWWATAFVLRYELREHFGQEFEISPWLTAFFSVFYLNYCLWAISDAPFPERSF